MKIARVTAVPLHVPLHIKLVGVDRETSLACCHVEVETDDGLIGHGLTSITEEDVIAQIVNGVAGPATGAGGGDTGATTGGGDATAGVSSSRRGLRLRGSADVSITCWLSRTVAQLNWMSGYCDSI